MCIGLEFAMTAHPGDKIGEGEIRLWLPSLSELLHLLLDQTGHIHHLPHYKRMEEG